MMEDNCESMGASYQGKFAGTFGVFWHFFNLLFTPPLHHGRRICCYRSTTNLYHYMLSIRAHGWTRNLPAQSKLHQKNENEFYESFCFVVPGFNLRPLEMEGALAVEQIKKLDRFVEQRRANAEYFKLRMSEFSKFYTQQAIGDASWFGFAIILRPQYAGV